MSKMRSIGLALAVVLLAACDEPTAPEPGVGETPSFAVGGVIESAVGSGHIVLNEARRSFAFSAQRLSDGSVSGTFELHSRQVDRRTHGDVVCMTRFGGMVWMGGIVTAGDFPGRGLVFRVMDGGAGVRGVRDLISLAQTIRPEDVQRFCDTTPSVPALSFEVDGNITVTAPGESSFTSVDRMEVSGLDVFVPCADGGNGEWVALEGTLQFLFHFTADPAGGYHYRSEVNPQDLSGRGSVTGDLYRGTGGTGSTTNGSMSGFPYTDTFVNNFRIIGQGTGNDLLVHVNGHFTVNANGDVTVSNANFSSLCS